VGSIFRTAEGAGVKKLYLCGYTPTPLDRFGRTRKDLASVALGAEKLVPWEQASNALDLIEKLKKQKYQIVALEQDKEAINYLKLKPQNKRALIVGNEIKGIPQSILKACDKIVEIPMKGKKESLNVAVAAGIAIFRFL